MSGDYMHTFKNNKVNINGIIYKAHNLGKYIVPKKSFLGVCVDIGSNVGSFLSIYGNKFKKVQFYEPLPICFEICKKKAPYADGFNEAVYNIPNIKMNMLVHYSKDCGSCALETDSINSDWINEIVSSVQTVDFPTVLKRAGGKIDYLKMDCETGEYHFLINNSLDDVTYIGMELHCQMGEKKWYELIRHIENTHIIYGEKKYCKDENRELLCLNKRKTTILEQSYYKFLFMIIQMTAFKNRLLTIIVQLSSRI